MECDSKKEQFYRSCKKCLEAVKEHSKAYAALALKMSDICDDKLRCDELKRIAEICTKVPACPAENFYEAVQAVHFVTYCLSFNPFRMTNQQFQLGHPDRYLFPFYEKDIQDNVITREFAQLLLDCLGIQINMRVGKGLSSGYMVGGRDENGAIVANELTEMCIQVIEDIRLVYPAAGFCYTEGMPEKYIKKACEMILKGYSHPEIFNDDVITKGLIYYGVSKEQAHNYIHSTYAEITPVAASNVWVASPYTKMVQLLLDIMDAEYSSFDELINKYLETLNTRIRANFEKEKRNRIIRAKHTINPLLSCFVNDCLALGTDIECGGGSYNWIMPSFVGMGNLIDSLYALKTLVFDKKKLTICDFKSILDNGFKDNEVLRLNIINNLPKYGNDIDEIDKLYGIIIEHIAAECEKYEGLHRNARLIPGVFCWVMHEQFGKLTPATPDGRKSGFPLGDGSGPCQGREMNGPTASILSSTKWNHSKLIGGYSDYFIRLSDEMQEEVIMRSAHEI